MLRAALLLALLARDGGSDTPAFALPTPPALDLPPPGTHVSRTMALLAGARPDHRPEVRVLVYGQSISKQSWSEEVRAALASRYPYADLVWRNLAIGGFSSPRLVRTVTHDLASFYPVHARGGW